MFKPTLMSARRRALKSSVAVGLSFATAAIATSLFRAPLCTPKAIRPNPLPLLSGLQLGVLLILLLERLLSR